MNIIASLFGDLKDQRLLNAQLESTAMTSAGYRELYTLLNAYYMNNSLYDRLVSAIIAAGDKVSPVKGIRNPAYRVVEFYVSSVWPGDLGDILKVDKKSVNNEQIIKDIELVWSWSNWQSKKDVAVRWAAIYGDLVIKVVTDSNEATNDDEHRHVGFQLIPPGTVTQIEHSVLHEDVIYIRIDTPVTPNKDDRAGAKIYETEIWNLSSDSFRKYRHDKTPEEDESKLGSPVIDVSILDRFGIDFLPFVHVKFKDNGEERGIGAYTLQVDKIDEANRMATRLHHTLYRYNRVTHALRSNSLDKDKRPIPAPIIVGSRNRSTSSDEDVIDIGGEKFIRLPGMSQLDQLVPNLDYMAHLEALKSHMDELAQDLPEMEYYRLKENADISARAVWYKMTPAIKRAQSAAANLDVGLIKANRMALVIGSVTKIFSANYGSSGEMLRDPVTDHKFAKRSVLQLSDIDTQELERGRIEIIISKKSAGLDVKTALEEMGYDNVDEIMSRKQEELTQMQQTFQNSNGQMPNREQINNNNGNSQRIRGFNG